MCIFTYTCMSKCMVPASAQHLSDNIKHYSPKKDTERGTHKKNVFWDSVRQYYTQF